MALLLNKNKFSQKKFTTKNIYIYFFVIVFNSNRFEMRLLNLRINFFIYSGLFVLILVVCLFFFFFFFLCVYCFFFYYVSAKFHLWPSSGDFTMTSDRNDESCNCIPSNYCLPLLLSITPHFFWPSEPLAGLGRIWNRYLLTMLPWNHRDSMPLSAAPQAPKGDQGWIFWSYKSLSGLP